MDTIVHSLSDGRRITVRIKRNARKNIILRPMAADAVSATIPPWLGRRQLSTWLSEREDLLLSVLSRAAVLPVEESLPSKLWLHGEQLDLVSGGHEGVLLLPSRVSVAKAGAEEQKELLRKEWRRRAAAPGWPCGPFGIPTCGSGFVECQNFLGHLPPHHGDTPQLAAGRRARFCGGLCLRA